ncbi:uncharacterized protein FHS61_001946 [Altererythrobacter atlanticus]|uniref:Uncharacterized protein n=1 Tax=Croceibacterium atlanticum TaxID=1267766 RepID=A0A0F7KLQ4_9SPHN|nr:DUF418 domain-containing protein [Croceibacterium atlanticum]AKH41458.1 hypothetical protein WYH_00399 [Croceibacterium atlanticum]MBB5732920.1 uncharacterized protein [Croceibacterium atlanticum]
MATTSPDRILVLDIIRGIAVMGIFSVNVVGMAMIEQAYFYPPGYGFGSLGDRIMWAANFILVDGKFRSLFSILFGASTILVIERGIAAGKDPWRVHYPRMAVLLLFGLAHFYFLWWGDILANYALVGMIAFIFWRLPVKWLLVAAAIALSAGYLPNMVMGGQQIAQYQAKAAPGASDEQRAALQELLAGLKPSEEALANDKAAHASIPAHFDSIMEAQPLRPFMSVFGYGIETLGLMLIGMAGYKSGFLTGSWKRRRYIEIAVPFIGASLIYFGIGAREVLRADFSPFIFFPWNQIYSGPLHPVAAIGYAALIILIFPKRGAIADRLAAVGRTAFTNYLGATIIGTILFFGFGLGLYGQLSRGQAWLFAPGVWLIMLLWSKPWLDRYRYGPFEWAWRSLSRWQWEPMLRTKTPGPPA